MKKDDLIFLDNETYRKALFYSFPIFKLKKMEDNINLNKNIIYCFNLKKIKQSACQTNNCNSSILLKQQIVKNWFINKLIQMHKDLNLKLNNNKSKPCFNNNSINFSISHSDNFVAFVWTNKPIGIDIQKIEKIDYEKILLRFNIDSNLTKIHNYSSFTKWWTQNESYIKFASSQLDNYQKDKPIHLATKRFKVKYFISVCC